MISSMTGYGRAELEREGVHLVAEVSSVNSRFCELSVRLPRPLSPLELKVRELVQQYVVRGRINLFITWEGLDDSHLFLSLDEDLARAYYRLLTGVKETLNLPGEVDVGILARFPDIFKLEPKEDDLDHAWSLVEEVARMAMEDMVAMRRGEGKRLEVDLRGRIDVLENSLAKIERWAPKRVEEAKGNLEERIKALTDLDEIDPQRLAMEVAVLAERCDITEECVRFHSHNQLFLSTLDEGGVVGRRLNFLLQEMNREANTIGSKANEAQISHAVVRIKEEVERLREQVQNVE